MSRARCSAGSKYAEVVEPPKLAEKFFDNDGKSGEVGRVWIKASGHCATIVVSVLRKSSVYLMEWASSVSAAACKVGGGGDHMVSSGSSRGMKRCSWMPEPEP